MPNLTVGTHLRDVPPLEGHWSVWSQANDCPGAFFVVPVDEPARAMGLKYAVVRAIQKHADPQPSIDLVRTDPSRPDLVDHTPKERSSR